MENKQELKACEDCGGLPKLEESHGITFYDYRCECGKRTWWRDSEMEAREQWQKHEKTPPTYESLRADSDQLKADLGEMIEDVGVMQSLIGTCAVYGNVPSKTEAEITAKYSNKAAALKKKWGI